MNSDDEAIQTLLDSNNSAGFSVDQNQAWEKVWKELIAPLIREKLATRAGVVAGSSPDSPGVTLLDMKNNAYTYESYPYALLRKLQRVYARFDLDAFLEDRSASDYVNNLDQEHNALSLEIRNTQASAKVAVDFIDAFERMYPSLGNQAKAMRVAIEGAKTKADDLQRVFSDAAFKSTLHQRIRGIHYQIQQDWGTFARRVKRPLYAFVGALIIALAMHVWIGFWTGTNAASLLIAWSGLVAFAAYRGGRNKVIEKKSRFLRQIAVFDPSDILAQTKLLPFKTIWSSTADSASLTNKAYENVIEDSDSGTSGAKYNGGEVVLDTTGPVIWVAALFALLVSSPPLASVSLTGSAGAPLFDVDGRAGNGACLFARGHIVWPGPVDLMVMAKGKNAETAVVRIPSNRLARVEMMSAAAANARPYRSTVAEGGCDGVTTPQPRSDASMVLVSQTRTPDKGVLLVPFVSPDAAPIKCEFSPGDKGVEVPEPYAPILKRLGARLKACAASAGRYPTIDVRGFSSNVKFKGTCDTNAKNWDLAEARRTNVLRALGYDPSSKGAFNVTHGAGNRWQGFDHMNDFASVAGPEEGGREAGDLSQRVEIWFDDLAGCKTNEVAFVRN